MIPLPPCKDRANEERTSARSFISETKILSHYLFILKAKKMMGQNKEVVG